MTLVTVPRVPGIDRTAREIINQHLYDYGQAQEIQFTRERPYKRTTTPTSSRRLDFRPQARGLRPPR
jgi:hypothetical protein